ncbi:MAG: hypothetical protein CO167_04625 [Candidatus Marinimicrobia bacterium CG_4_9_14_3_um_filter_48_9]|nr:MAG: hypothetical protein CO167_04625 [Candidatus Marinimicrobia bacterium CG_4_9_14_3_um_filter_48_9]
MIRQSIIRSFGEPSRRWKHLLNFLIFAVLAYWFLPRPYPGADELRVMTYNIRHGLGIDRVLDLTRIAAVINDFQPDIVILNEVDMGTGRSNGIQDMAQLAVLTRLNGYFARSINFDGGEYGNGLLSRWSISGKLDVWDISTAISQEGRSVFRALIPIKSDTLQIFGTHFGLVEQERTTQARFIDSLLVTAIKRYPTILAGDFNFIRSSPGYQIISRRIPDTYKFLGLDSIKTYPVPNPEKTIDYIFASLHWTGIQAVPVSIATADTASDHYPLQVVLVP